MIAISRPLALIAALGLTACASGSSEAMPTAATPAAQAPAAQRPASTPATQSAAQPEAAAGALSFSAEQADNGRTAFRASCTECHNSSEFRDRQFKFKWRRRTAGDLFELVATSMPEDSPGSLEGTQYAAIVAYILRLNGFEEGTGELPADIDALEAISLAQIAN